MTPPTLSDANPSIIINELLCFLYNKMDIVVHDTLVKLTCDFYESSEIEETKKLLYTEIDAVTAIGQRLIYRKGPNKDVNNVDDILTVLHRCNSEDLPSFVACNLSRLPPVDINSIDMSIMLSEFQSMRKEFVVMRKDLQTMKDYRNNFAAPDLTDTQYTMPVSTGSPGDSLINQIPFRVPQSSEPKASTIVHEPHETIPELEQNNSNNDTNIHFQKDQDGWVTYTRRKNKSTKTLGITGNASSKFVAVKKPRVAHLFATRFSPDVTNTDLKKYLSELPNFQHLDIKCTKLQSKYPSNYSSFYIQAECENPEAFMEPDVWPTGILVRWYRKAKPSSPTDITLKTASSPTVASTLPSTKLAVSNSRTETAAPEILSSNTLPTTSVPNTASPNYDACANQLND